MARDSALSAARIRQLAHVPAARSLFTHLRDHDVIPVLRGEQAIRTFLAQPTESCVVGDLSILQLSNALPQMLERNIHPIIDIDTIGGIQRDRAGLEWLESLGGTGTSTTRLSLIQFAGPHGFMTIQTLVLGGASLLSSAHASVSSSRPHIALVCPAPVLDRLDQDELAKLRPFMTSGFVRNVADVEDALAHGAIGVTSSVPELWHHKRAASL